jgi:hypothetical protein
MSEQMNEATYQAHEAVREASEDSEQVLAPDPAPDRTMETKTPGFSRMRVDWNPHDLPVLGAFKQIVEARVMEAFTDAYLIMEQVYDLVREPEVDETTSEIKVDRFGFKVWKTKPTGGYYEDFTVLTDAERLDLVFRISTRLFDWKQRAANLWGDAMFAKAIWEEAFALGFDEPKGRLTVDDRTQKGRIYSREERYFAILQSLLSRRADAVVSSMELLGLRLSQSLKTNS